VQTDPRDDPCDTVLFYWQSDLHKQILLPMLYGSVDAQFIGDPCDDWTPISHPS
tara:strand:+ start:40476 stop:40637 length:162 start_codon:yes stop_codon:yes gene_type:complete